MSRPLALVSESLRIRVSEDYGQAVLSPAAQDPFVNTPLISLGSDEHGEERFWITSWNRFWITSWNSVSGTQGIMITETGREQIFRFGPDDHGFYNAALEDQNTLWLCGYLSTVVRLDLCTGRTERYDTGAPPGLAFAGMTLDPASGKLFAVAFSPPSTTAFSFDFRNRSPVRTYPGVCAEHYQTSSFANRDGSYTVIVYNPDVALLRWDPVAETVDTALISHLAGRPIMQVESLEGISSLIRDDAGRVFFPAAGWYDPIDQVLTQEGPFPERRMTWFGRRGDRAFGASMGPGLISVAAWDLTTGTVTDLCSIPDGTLQGIALSESAHIVAMTMYGTFYRFAADGALLLSKHVKSDSIGHVDCLRRISADRLLGTTFITQRFWELDLASGQGADLGRAAPGSGEVLQTWKIDGTIYLAAYTGAELVEYSPDQPARFPENPRVVAKPPTGMRPVAAADHGRIIFYSASHRYGHLGSVLVRYDTTTGAATYRDDPLRDRMIRSLVSEPGGKTLLAGTTMDADCQSAPATSQECLFARIDASSLKVSSSVAAPAGTRIATVHGLVDAEQRSYLCTITGSFSVNDADPTGTAQDIERPDLADANQLRWFVLIAGAGASAALPAFALEDTRRLPNGASSVVATGRHGLFILQAEHRFTLWDLRPSTPVLLAAVCDEPGAYACHVQDGANHILLPRHVLIDDDLLGTLS